MWNRRATKSPLICLERKQRQLQVARRMKVVGVGALVSLAVLVLWGVLSQPDQVTPERSAIIGTWTNPDGARLVFRADGTCIADGMTFVPDGSGADDYDVLPVNGRGTWYIEPWDASAGSGGGVNLTFAGIDTFLDTTGDPAHPSLFAAIGDPDEDDHFTFTKQSDSEG